MPEILGDVRALAYVEGWAKKEGVWAKSAFCGQKAKFAGQKKIIHGGTPGSGPGILQNTLPCWVPQGPARALPVPGASLHCDWQSLEVPRASE